VAVRNLTATTTGWNRAGGRRRVALRKSAVKQAGCASVVQVRLAPTSEEAVRLAAAVAVCNAAATYASRIAWEQACSGSWRCTG
jgi:hypothetical protein